MRLREGYHMKTDRLLISSAMLTAMCDDSATDNLKLLEKLVLVCIADTCRVGSSIDKKQISEKMEQRFGFKEIPSAVLEKIFQRMSRGKLAPLSCHKQSEFILTKNLDQVRNNFETYEQNAQSDTKDVVQELVHWFQVTTPKLKVVFSSAADWLAEFFEMRGVDVLFDTDELLSNTVSNTDTINYQISQFILEARNSNNLLFNKISNIVQGSMIAAAMFVNIAEPSQFIAARRLTGLSVYLDTTLLLYALDYKLPEQKRAADSLLDLLRENGASLYVLPQHYAEIMDILKTYRDRDAYSRKLNHTLERLDAENVTTIEVDQEIIRLPSLFDRLGISIAEKSTHFGSRNDSNEIRSKFCDYEGLRKYILQKIPMYSRSSQMLENDLDAISYIINMRDGMRFNSIESSTSLFVTTNDTLVREANRFLRYDSYKFQISPIISDTDLTAILWVKYAMKNHEIPRIQLIETARAAASPSASVMRSFYDITSRFVKRGDMTEDEAANLRFSAFARAEIMSECGGDPAALDDTSVMAVQRRVREQYAAEAIEREKIAQSEAKEAKDKLQEIEQQFNSKETSIKQKIGDLRKAAYKNAEFTAKSRAAKLRKALSCVVVLLMILFGTLTAYNGIKTGTGFISAIVTVISAVSAFVLLVPALELRQRFEEYAYHKLFDIIFNQEIARVQPQIDTLKSILDA